MNNVVSSPSALPSANRIRRLDQDTVDKIAAAEIIQRPSNAIKELLENALDAGATRISVVAKEGGLKTLSIQDNGSGIHEEDLPLLCERYCTSKLSRFEDLRSLNSYGFRGEALASISHVARLTCSTKRKEQPYGLKAVYAAGHLTPARPGASDAAPKPTAANQGTNITVEDMFANVPMRRKSFKSPQDEYSRILDAVSKYAIHNAGVAITCKKYASNSLDLNTRENATVPDNIGHVYGDGTRRDLVHTSMARNEQLGFSAEGWTSGANFAGKKSTYLFFINHRLVDCQSLRKALEAFYSTLLPKGGCHPFVYLSLLIDAHRLDVNVHPTKHEVVFENEEEIIQEVIAAVSTNLAEQASSRRFTSTQAQSSPQPSTHRASSNAAQHQAEGSSAQSRRSSSGFKSAPQKVVRTDSTARTLDGMFGFSAKQSGSKSNDTSGPQDASLSVTEAPDQEVGETNPLSTSKRQPATNQNTSTIKTTKCNLSSIQQLRRGVENAVHHELQTIIKQHIFVGLVGADRPESLIQHQTKLFMVDHTQLAEELFYQLGLRQFGRIGQLSLSPAPRLNQLVSLAVSEESEAEEQTGLSHADIVERISKTLVDRRDMLQEYFSLSISEDGTLLALPLLLPQYMPNLDKLPLFLLRAGLEVTWTSEKECFDSFLRELAFFYTPTPLMVQIKDTPAELSKLSDEQKWTIQHVIFPAMQRYLVPSVKLVNANSIKQVASMESLFKVFERC